MYSFGYPKAMTLLSLLHNIQSPFVTQEIVFPKDLYVPMINAGELKFDTWNSAILLGFYSTVRTNIEISIIAHKFIFT